jgi:hypothetical protein
MLDARAETAMRGRWRRRIREATRAVPMRRAPGAALALALSALTVAALSASSTAAAGDPPVVTPIAVEVLDPPDPVLGADNRNHLAYELKVANLGRSEVTLDSVQPRTGGKPFGGALEGELLAPVFRLDNVQPGTTMAPGVGATIFMDVTYPAHRRAPATLSHRFGITVRDPSGVKPPRVMSFTGVRTLVHRRKAIEVASPLRGGHWLAGNGCCVLTPHRGATLPIDGTIHVPERFAIDFVQLDAQDRLFSGPADALSSYAFVGARIHAVAPGRVVSIQDGLPEQVPGTFPTNPTLQEAEGNYVVERIGAGRYAFYTHMQPGSLRVRKGTRVRSGQVIGLLGNSGNSDGPHLHFHIMDAPSPLLANGLPFTFKSFRGEGVVEELDPLFTGAPAQIDPGALAGRHRGQLPLNNQLLDFGR